MHIITNEVEYNKYKLMKEFILYVLSKSDFFDYYVLKSYECIDNLFFDLSFVLIDKNKNVNFNDYINYLKDKLLFYNLDYSFKDNILIINNMSIQFEIVIDNNPCNNLRNKLEYRFLPFPFVVRIYDNETLFALNIKDILQGNINVKILYRYVLFLTKDIRVNIGVLNIDINILKNMLNEKFKLIDYEAAKNDVAPFLDDSTKLNIWSMEFFQSITDNLHEEQ